MYPNYPPPPAHPSQAANPQQAYAAQYGQAPPPPGYPQYAPQPGYPAPGSAMPPLSPPQPAAAAYTQPNVVEPTGGGGGGMAPLPRNLYGYAIMALPTSYDPNNQGPGGGIKPRVTVDFVVVGVDPQGNPMPPIEFGESQDRDPSKQRPPCYRLDAFPAEFRGAWWSNSEIVKWLAPLVGTGNVTMGRIRQGDQGNRPPLFEVMAPDDAARAALNAAWQQRTLQPGSLVRKVGEGLAEINGGPPVKTPAAAPAQPAYPPAPGYPQQAQASPYGYPPAPQPGYGGPVAPPPPGAQVSYAQPAAPAAPAGAVPPGWTPEAWVAAPPHIRQAYGQP